MTRTRLTPVSAPSTWVIGSPLLLLALGTTVPPAQAQTPSLPEVQAARTPESPVIDGLVDEAEWAAAEPWDDFIQQEPREGLPATERTAVRVMFDRENLYIGVVCYDSDPEGIVVTESRRDGDLDNTDALQVVLDTFDDNQNAFLFGTNPLGLEYDGQVAAEGRTGGSFGNPGSGFGGGGSQRGALAGFNRNWDGDWTVRAQVTPRGWEAEMAIPLKTLRYSGGTDQSWGFNVMRNIRRKNEQVFLAPVPRSYNIYRISLAGNLNGLDLPGRRDVKATPYMLTGYTQDYTVVEDQGDALRDIGLDIKWGVTPNLTADFTVNTDFAQVEADEEQVNLTRFSLFFPEKRAFFLENAATFQFGQPQQIDLFFSRRVGLSSSGRPIDIIGGGRLTGRVGGYNIGLLNMQTEEAIDHRTGDLIAPSNNFTVLRLQREFGRSNVGGIVVNRQGMGDRAAPSDYNRAYGIDANIATSANGKIFSFLSRSDSPGDRGSDYSARALYDYNANLWSFRLGYTQVGEDFNAEVGFVPRVGYRKPEARLAYTPKIQGIPWIRQLNPHVTLERFYGFDGRLQTEWQHYDFTVNLQDGGRTGFRLDRRSDRPEDDFIIFESRDGEQVIIPPGLYTWNEWFGTYATDPSTPVFVSAQIGAGSFYDGHFNRWSFDSGFRYAATFVTTVGYIRNNIDLSHGDFSNDLVRVKSNYFFSTNTLVQALIQFNSQTQETSSNIRFAWLNRSGTGLFFVFNERRDTFVDGTEPLGRSFIVKYNRLIDF